MKAPRKKAKTVKSKVQPKRKSLHERLKERAILEENAKSLDDESEEDTDTEKEVDKGMEEVDLGEDNGHQEDDLQGEENEDDDY